MRFTLRVILMLGMGLLIAACGSVATPRPTFEPTNTAQARLVKPDEEESDEVENAEAEAESAAVPTVAPTATLAPTTTPVPTEVPTEIPTEAPTAEPTEEIEATEHADDHTAEEHAAEDAVVVNGLVGDPANGEGVFRYFPNPDPNAVKPNCVGCHNPDEPIADIAPYLYGIGTNAQVHADLAGKGQTAIEYLYESITDPNAFIAPPQTKADGTEVVWNPGLMPQNWGDVLDDQQIADLVAYLMTLTQGEAHEH